MDPCKASKTPYILSELILILNIAVCLTVVNLTFRIISSPLLGFLSVILSVSFDPCCSGCEMFPE